jgi:protein-S-isoprenylcysteine O-methyltransferase Ste14
LFWLDYGLLGVIGLAYPGLTHYDQLLGIRPLSLRPLCVIIGGVLLLPALYLSLVSNRALRQLGQGANAFRLTRNLVEGDIYRCTRNPMSLGFYLTCIALGLLAGSTSITLGAWLGVIPAHIFYLKYFEEFELELRLGQAYRDYRQRVPFLVPKWSSKESSGAST